MNDLILYKKIGRKYIPASQYEDMDYLRTGSYLLQVRPGHRSLRTLLNVDAPALEAGLAVVAEGIHEAIRKARNTPINGGDKKLTKKQQEAMKIFMEAFKTDTVWLPSESDVVSAGIAELRKYMKKEREARS